MTMMNETIKSQLGHRTIRKFKERKISKDIMDLLLEVAARTATSTGMQAASIIRITDPEVKESVANVCGQAYVATAPELLIFIVDQYRNSQIAKEKGYSPKTARDMDRFIASFTDACLMAQNLVVAAESLGLGTVYLGSILNDIQRICELLSLADLTFPVLGLALGYPDQDPQLKPRMDMSLRVFENSYQLYDSYLDKIKDYDKEMSSYCDLREPGKYLDSFSDQVVSRFSYASPKENSILKAIRKQGFDTGINKDDQ